MTSWVFDTVWPRPPHAAIRVPKPGKMIFRAAQRKASGLDMMGTVVAKFHTYRSISSKTSTFVLKKLTDVLFYDLFGFEFSYIDMLLLFCYGSIFIFKV